MSRPTAGNPVSCKEIRKVELRPERLAVATSLVLPRFTYAPKSRPFPLLPTSSSITRYRFGLPKGVRGELEQRLADAVDTKGVNSWEAAFHRGARADNDVLSKLAERVSNLPR